MVMKSKVTPDHLWNRRGATIQKLGIDFTVGTPYLHPAWNQSFWIFALRCGPNAAIVAGKEQPDFNPLKQILREHRIRPIQLERHAPIKRVVQKDPYHPDIIAKILAFTFSRNQENLPVIQHILTLLDEPLRKSCLQGLFGPVKVAELENMEMEKLIVEFTQSKNLWSFIKSTLAPIGYKVEAANLAKYL